jgi:hypothetical protein
MRAVLSVVED